MPVLPEDAHVKTFARLLVDRLANPSHYPDMNDGTIDWQKVYRAMRQAHAEDGHMFDVLGAGLVALSGYNPWGGEVTPTPKEPDQ